ncbi:MAG: TonB family protein [Bryobacteraceae bacterium]|jgi:TonB family protein
MTNSTIPAEAVGSPSPVTASFRWEVPTKSTCIQISLDLIDRLEREVIESFKAVTKRGSEVGGILLGRIARADKRTVFVENYESVTCDYSRGPLYLLSDPDKDQLRQVLQRLKSSPLSVVGFFRSNTRKDLVIDQDEDVAIAQEFFSDPNCVFLLVKPFAMKPSTAGFFLWEDGRIPPESPLQFPFRRSELQKGFPQLIVQPGEDKSAATAAPAPVAREERAGPVVVPKREERPPLSPPPALKREEPKLGPVVVPPKRDEPPVAKREEPAPPPVIPPKREERPPVAPLSFRREERPAVVPPPPKREEPAAPPKREERAAPPPILPKREERPAPLPLNLKREERLAAPIVAPKREEPAPPPLAPKREEPAPPPVTARREERPPILPKREERPIPVPSVAKPAQPVTPKPEEPPKREERPPVQPIVAKREEPAPAPPAEKKEERKEERAPVAQKREERKEERAAVAAAPAKLEPAPAVAPVKAEEPVLAAAEEPAKRGKIWLWAAIVVVLLLAAGGYYVYRLRTVAPEVKPVDTSLALKVERNAGQLVLSWNRDADLVKTAQTATLTITDGDHTEDVPVDVGQLRGGSVVYAPITNDVSFKLEVNDQKRGISKSESVRVLAGRPSPLMQQAPPKPVAAAEPKGLPTSATSVPPPQTSTPAPVSVQTPTPPVEQPKPSAPVKVAEAKPASAPGTVTFPEPPPIERQNPAIPARVNLAPTTPVVPPPSAVTKPAPAKPAPGAVQTPPAAPSESAALKVGGNVQEARVISRVPPAYPQLARQARVAGTVKVEATIGKDGRVRAARAVSGPPLLRRAAEDAVRQWKYQAGMLNGEPTEVTTQVDVSFTLQR